MYGRTHGTIGHSAIRHVGVNCLRLDFSGTYARTYYAEFVRTLVSCPALARVWHRRRGGEIAFVSADSSSILMAHVRCWAGEYHQQALV